MNSQLKTILLTILTLSLFVIAMVELSGVSNTALFNKYGIGNGSNHVHDNEQLADAVKNLPKTVISFDDTKHVFKPITEGTIAKHAFHFKNMGDKPLIISRAVASCGCTVPSYPKEPIPPGGEGDIVVEFNSANRVGMQRKNVMVYSNAQMEAMSVGFEVEVLEK